MAKNLSDARLRVYAWATPNPGMSLDDLIVHMNEIGNTVLVIDREGNRLKMMDVTQDLSPEQVQEITKGAAHV